MNGNIVTKKGVKTYRTNEKISAGNGNRNR